MSGSIKFTQIISVDRNILKHLREVDEKTKRRGVSRGEVVGATRDRGQSGHDKEKFPPSAFSPGTEVGCNYARKLNALKLQTGRNTGNKIPAT